MISDILSAVLYFAYGSNLDADAVSGFARAEGLDPSVVRPVGRAWLPDHEPVFHYRSERIDGGALDVRPRRGAVTPGALFEVKDGFALLDHKEGIAAGCHRRTGVTALTSDGHRHAAQTYVVADAHRGDFCAPTDAYLEAVARGLRHYRHDDSGVRAAARNRRPYAEPSSIFVYGSLRSGQSNASLLAGFDPLEEGKAVVHGTVRGRLLDFGSFPGLVHSDNPLERVHGEVYSFVELEGVLAELDRLEDFHGYGKQSSEYERVIVAVDLDGRERIAWTYLYTGPQTDARAVPRGDWVRHLGQNEARV
jgi:gamma-glutamylcyclotransferase (GGCT)/AIG2-like uncharacterized protein YtfP